MSSNSPDQSTPTSPVPNPPSPSTSSPPVPRLNIGTVISKGIEMPTLFFEEDDTETHPFSVEAELIATGRTSVVGSSGSGKSYAVGVICEELCKSKVPFVIIDTEGEYSGLKEKYEAIWVGEDTKCDLQWSKKVDLKRLASYAPDCPPIILDLSEASRPMEKVNEFLISIYREISRRRTPYLIILEEADRFSPQSGGERLPIFDEIARRGRKRGVGLMLCTQRPSLVDKNILSQCSNQLIGRLVIRNDLSSVAQFFSGHTPSNQLTELKPGEFFALGGLSPEPEKVKMRIRETSHGGMTPSLNPTAMKASVAKILESLQMSSMVNLRLQPEAQSQDEQVEGEVILPKQAKPLQKSNEIAVISQDQVIDESRQEEEIQRQQEEERVEPLTIDDTLDWVNADRKTSGIVGLAPMIEAESVPRLVKLEKSYKLFGQKENVTRVGLAFRPLVEIGVRIRSGVLKKRFDTKYFFLDGVNGKLIVPSDRLLFKGGIERLFGLQEGQIIVLRALHPEKDLSLIEVASAARRPEEETRRLLRGLEAKRLVRSTRVGRYNMYRRLADLPKIELGSEPLMKLTELNASDGFKLVKLKLKEEQVREVVKGLWDGADVESFKQIYYPVYLAEMLLNQRKRYVWIDGRSGKEIEI